MYMYGYASEQQETRDATRGRDDRFRKGKGGGDIILRWAHARRDTVAAAIHGMGGDWRGLGEGKGKDCEVRGGRHAYSG